MGCILLSDPVRSASHHMAFDRELVEGGNQAESISLESPALLVRFYEWENKGAITIGRFLLEEELIKTSFCIEKSIGIATRPTGGGLLLHSEADCSFSLFIPREVGPIYPSPQENYIQIHKCIYSALSKVTQNRLQPSLTDIEMINRPYCMASCTKYDITMNGRKIGGSACRITKKGLLFQASLFLHKCNWAYFLPFLVQGSIAIKEMQSVSSSIEELLQSDLPSRERVQEEIYSAFCAYSTC